MLHCEQGSPGYPKVSNFLNNFVHAKDPLGMVFANIEKPGMPVNMESGWKADFIFLFHGDPAYWHKVPSPKTGIAK